MFWGLLSPLFLFLYHEEVFEFFRRKGKIYGLVACFLCFIVLCSTTYGNRDEGCSEGFRDYCHFGHFNSIVDLENSDNKTNAEEGKDHVELE